MDCWSSGSDTGGLAIPWFQVRRELAEKYGCLPFEVDEWPRAELLQEIRLMGIERPYLARRKVLELRVAAGLRG